MFLLRFPNARKRVCGAELSNHETVSTPRMAATGHTYLPGGSCVGLDYIRRTPGQTAHGEESDLGEIETLSEVVCVRAGGREWEDGRSWRIC